MAQPAFSSADAAVLVVDEPTLFAESLSTALVLEGYDVHRVSPEDMLGSVNGHSPEIAVVDLDVEAEHDVLRIIRSLALGRARVLVVTAYDNQDRWAECVELGAAAVVSKNVSLDELVAVVRRVVAGHPMMTDREREDLLRTWHDHERTQKDRNSRFARLDAGERWVLGHLMNGRIASDIARLGAVSPYFVNAQIRSILGKLKVSSTLAAVALANDHDWTPPPV